MWAVPLYIPNSFNAELIWLLPANVLLVSELTVQDCEHRRLKCCRTCLPCILLCCHHLHTNGDCPCMIIRIKDIVAVLQYEIYDTYDVASPTNTTNFSLLGISWAEPRGARIKKENSVRSFNNDTKGRQVNLQKSSVLMGMMAPALT